MRGRGSRCGGRRLLGALLLMAAALWARVQMHSELTAEFLDVTPHTLAHFLADFSNYPKLYTDIESWSVNEESGNYTWWRYSVSYSCGARCVGRTEVWHVGGAGGESAPRHGASSAHRLRVTDARCAAVPLVPFLRLCEEQAVETVVVEGTGGGSRLQETAIGACGAVQAFTGRCRLAERRQSHLDALRLLISSVS